MANNAIYGPQFPNDTHLVYFYLLSMAKDLVSEGVITTNPVSTVKGKSYK